ncbi:MAG: hypothetical protein VKJ46_14595 [Leptolyngbyaceae bacterium]|nr:hypothetical protein [Leptolyngbyaceae bacterium]
MKRSYLSICSIVLACILIGGGQAIAKPKKTCSFDPSLGKPNPLGMRAFITIQEEEGYTSVIFEQFSSRIDSKRAVTISTRRELNFHNTNLKQTRTLLLQTPQYYSELVGYEDPDGFAPVNRVLTCR